jgi:UDP:flavonoid glycosyltransferase YjiC (YdhE family)
MQGHRTNFLRNKKVRDLSSNPGSNWDFQDDFRVNPIPNPVYVADYLHGMETCKISDFVICNGGSGTVYQALGAGVPVIGVAANVDQMAVIAPVVRKGAGRRIPAGRVEAVNWETEVTTLLNSIETQRNARQIANVMAQTGSAGAFLSLLEQAVGIENNPEWGDLVEPALLS